MKSILKVAVLAALTACQPLKKTGTMNSGEKAQAEKTTDTTAYFKATGVEPFWGLKISDESIEFTSLSEGTEKLTFHHSDPILAMDANVKLYRSTSYLGQLNVQIAQQECINEMSGAKFPYKVTVQVKGKNDKDFKTLSGCGQYVTDYRLHDIWVLEKMSGKVVSPTDFQKELPNMEINAAENTFMGYAGCNRMRGQLFYEKKILRFEKAATTLMMCQPGNKESEFLQALAASTTYYIANNRLVLSNPDKETLIFKKVD